jgi:hypothetical protein
LPHCKKTRWSSLAVLENAGLRYFEKYEKAGITIVSFPVAFCRAAKNPLSSLSVLENAGLRYLENYRKGLPRQALQSFNGCWEEMGATFGCLLGANAGLRKQ